MSTECKICKGTGNEPGELGCVWCDETGKAGGLNPAPSDELSAFRAYMAANPMATYWSVWQERAKIGTAELEQYQARRRQFAEEMNGRLTVLEERADELEPLLKNLRKAHEFKALCLGDRETADDVGATRDAYEWCRTAGDELAAYLIKQASEVKP